MFSLAAKKDRDFFQNIFQNWRDVAASRPVSGARGPKHLGELSSEDEFC